MGRIVVRGVVAGLVLAGAAAFGAAHANAAGTNPVISVSIVGPGLGAEPGDDQYDVYAVDSQGEANPDGTFTLTGLGYGTTFSCDWSVTVDPDPAITGTFNMTNITGVTNNYILNVSLPVPLGFGLPNLQGGYIGHAITGTEFFDQDAAGIPANGDGTVDFNSVGTTPIYQARIGTTVFTATTVQGLLLGTFGTFGGPGVFGSINQQTWGAPIPSAPGTLGVPVGGIMNIQVTFSLTPGDRVRLPVNFVIAAPEPGAVVLIGLGLAAIAGLRARRS